MDSMGYNTCCNMLPTNQLQLAQIPPGADWVDGFSRCPIFSVTFLLQHSQKVQPKKTNQQESPTLKSQTPPNQSLSSLNQTCMMCRSKRGTELPSFVPNILK